MKLYDYSRAPNPRRVRIFLAEKGITVDTEQVDIAVLAHLTPEMLAKNPMKRVPMLELDDGTVIAEAQAICRYFEFKHPEKPLFGTTAEEEGLIEMWSRRAELELLYGVGAVFRHTSPHMSHREIPQVPDFGKAALGKLPETLKIFNEALKGKEFLVGNRFTMADINMQCGLDFLRIIKMEIPEELTDLRRVHALLSARPSAKA